VDVIGIEQCTIVQARLPQSGFGDAGVCSGRLPGMVRSCPSDGRRPIIESNFDLEVPRGPVRETRSAGSVAADQRRRGRAVRVTRGRDVGRPVEGQPLRDLTPFGRCDG